jgi:hypothetical protein
MGPLPPPAFAAHPQTVHFAGGLPQQGLLNQGDVSTAPGWYGASSPVLGPQPPPLPLPTFPSLPDLPQLPPAPTLYTPLAIPFSSPGQHGVIVPVSSAAAANSIASQVNRFMGPGFQTGFPAGLAPDLPYQVPAQAALQVAPAPAACLPARPAPCAPLACCDRRLTPRGHGSRQRQPEIKSMSYQHLAGTRSPRMGPAAAPGKAVAPRPLRPKPTLPLPPPTPRAVRMLPRWGDAPDCVPGSSAAAVCHSI